MGVLSKGCSPEHPNVGLLNPDGGVAGSLKRSLPMWEAARPPAAVLEWINHGVSLRFRSTLRPIHIPNRTFNEREHQFVREERDRLLASEAISRRQHRPFACLPLGVVPKKNGKLRLIHDERYINAHMEVPKFKNEGLDAVADMVEPGDLLAKLDLKDGYHHIPIALESRDYLGFEIDGDFFVWNILPFGLAISPYIFVKTIRPTLQLLRSKGIRINAYMDDFRWQRSQASSSNIWRRCWRCCAVWAGTSTSTSAT